MESGPRDNPFAPPRARAESWRPAATNVRPTSGTVFGVLNIIFGALTLVFVPIGLAVLLAGNTPKGANPVTDVMAENPTYFAINVTSSAVAIVAHVVLLASGIGLLQGRPYGRTLAIGFAWYALVMVVVNFVVFLTFLYRPLSDLYAKAVTPADIGAALGGLIGGFAGPLIYPIFPGLMLYFMTRPHVVAYYSGRKPYGHDTLDAF
jgi:hypothetical protein